MRFNKNLLIATLLALSFSTWCQTEGVTSKTYSIEDLANHNTEASCWIAIEGTVYDVTSFLKSHPAPYKILIKYCGKESTQGFRNKDTMGEKHSKKALRQLEKLKIGELKK